MAHAWFFFSQASHLALTLPSAVFATDWHHIERGTGRWPRERNPNSQRLPLLPQAGLKPYIKHQYAHSAFHPFISPQVLSRRIHVTIKSVFA